VVVGRGGAVRLGTATNPPTAETTQVLTGLLPSTAARRRRVVVGRGRTTIPDGQTHTVVAKLNAQGQRTLRARRTLTVSLQIVARGPGGEIATVTHRMTLRSGVAGRSR
jgi:hypothetical protein